MFIDLLKKNRRIIIEKWFGMVLESYEAYAIKFLKKNQNQFGNPVGHAIQIGIEEIFDLLLLNSDSLEWPKSMEEIVKIRAVQDFSPSKAIEFPFLLKKVLSNTLAADIKKHNLFESQQNFEQKIDQMALSAFDMYMEAKKKLFQIKINEIKSGMYYTIQEHSAQFDGSDISNIVP
jgi:hypothetical protein